MSVTIVAVDFIQPATGLDLTIDQGASFTLGPLCWIAGGVPFNPASTTASAIFRQVPTDAPLASITTTPNAQGSIVYGAPIVNYPYFPPSLAGESGQTPVLLTLYPITVSITTVGVAALLYPFCRWKLNLVNPDTTSFDLCHGDVQVNNV